MSEIRNSLQSSDLNVTALADPARIKFLVASIADQINSSRMDAHPPKRCVDLSDHIADIIIETSVQGAALLEVHIIDPAWMLLQRDQDGVSFIDVDEQGYLWPPIEVNFPPDVSDSTWRLCSCQPTTDLTAANLTLVFEDKIVAELREHAGPVLSRPNETRAEFIRRLVKLASQNPLSPHEVGIRFIPLLPQSVFSTQDLTADQVSLPASAKQPRPPPARSNPNKDPAASGRHLTPVQQGTGDAARIIAKALNGTALSIGEGAGLVMSPLLQAIVGQGYVPGMGTYEPPLP